MKHQVMPNLTFGNELACTHDATNKWAVVHACKAPSHRRAVGYASRSLSSSHANYLVLPNKYHLYLNLIDPPQPLFKLPSFVAFFAFVGKHIEHHEVIIHCNQGKSLALLYADKRSDQFPADYYAAAAQAFRGQFMKNRGRSIHCWLTSNWVELG